MNTAVETTILPAAAPLRAPDLTMPELTVVETERDQFAKARGLIIDALRANGDKQITGQIFNEAGDKFCFVGCAVKALASVES